MFICNCNGLRERDVDAVIRGGACDPVEVHARLGCEPNCGRCLEDMRRLIEEARSLVPAE